MKELIELIAGLSPSDRFNLICYLHIKYKDDNGRANIYNWWPGSEVSPKLKELLENDNSCSPKQDTSESQERDNRPSDYCKNI